MRRHSISHNTDKKQKCPLFDKNIHIRREYTYTQTHADCAQIEVYGYDILKQEKFCTDDHSTINIQSLYKYKLKTGLIYWSIYFGHFKYNLFLSQA